jgi:DEAD/DEAH box helicase domain-containing protein
MLDASKMHLVYYGLMRTIVFDIETANQFSDISSGDPADLTLAIVCIHDSLTDAYDSFTVEELPRLWKVLEQADVLVGYNSDHFDIPLLNKYYPGDLNQIKSIDLLKDIHKSLGRRIKLDMVAEGTLGEGKSGHGLQSIKWWREGLVDKVREYCIKDVEITKRIFEYAKKNGSIRYKDMGAVREVRIDTRDWSTKKAESAVTHTLGF